MPLEGFQDVLVIVTYGLTILILSIVADRNRVPLLACKVHGAAAMAWQDAMPVRPSPGSKGDLKRRIQPGLNGLERRAPGWPFIS